MNFDLAQGRLVLERTPATLRTLLHGLPDTWTQSNEGANKWSPHEVIAHLINGERTDWIPRARLILAGDRTAKFVAFDREGFFVEGRARPLAELLDLFAVLRAESRLRSTRWGSVSTSSTSRPNIQGSDRRPMDGFPGRSGNQLEETHLLAQFFRLDRRLSE